MSHLVLMTLYAALVGFFFALLWRRGRKEQTKLFLQIFLGMMLGAILVGLLANYVAFLAPKLSLASNMLLMMAILLWRPAGLYAVARR